MSDESWKEKLHSDSSRDIKSALDYFTSHLDEAIEHKAQISALRQFSEDHLGMGAVQVEVAAIILYNQLTFKPGG